MALLCRIQKRRRFTVKSDIADIRTRLSADIMISALVWVQISKCQTPKVCDKRIYFASFQFEANHNEQRQMPMAAYAGDVMAPPGSLCS